MSLARNLVRRIASRLRFEKLRGVVALAALFVPTVAGAQATTAPIPAPPPPASSDSAAPAGAGSGGAPATDDKAPEKKVVPAAGYAYSDKPQKRTTTTTKRALRKAPAGPTATFPGFEQLPDGGSRLFVHLTQSVPVEERRAQGSITYVLKGAHVRQSNNTNSLVTVHFNTPVSKAKLVPHGNDLLFVVDLRAASAPTWKMQDAPDKSATLNIEFPKGDFGVDTPSAGNGGAPGTVNVAPTTTDRSSAPAKPTKATRGKGKPRSTGAGGGPSGPKP
jgi:hypothetical protein